MTLSCEISHADAKVTWLKDEADLPSNDRFQKLSEGKARRLKIRETTLEDEAEYTVLLSETVSTKATLWVEG